MTEYQSEGNMDQSNVSEELGVLRNDFNQLRADLNDLLQAFKHEKVSPMKEAIKGHAQERIKQMQEAIANLKHHSRRATEACRRKIEERPIATALTAFAIGIIVGKLVIRRWR